ncbi:MAG: N-acetyltransferase [Mesorhizobium sp.]|uniref:GNAT family N-acetyltransferase n=1 Tax=Mesorhizobium sp. TaxID=1871066 RepID=UPI000FE9B12C|nr:GNAT family N-acetyltransferase [Mesorhizobium sp.]RWM12534.1 MAG: N-acetyltransferase [Mesorhizobium sp.]
MNIVAHPQHDLSAAEIDAIEGRLYDYNRQAVGRSDAEGLGFVIRNEAGCIVGVVAGYSWAGTSELKQMWVDQSHRGRGYGRALLRAFIAEAKIRAVRRIWVQSYDFQAPSLYEKAGFVRVAEFADWPEAHSNVILCKTLLEQAGAQ